MKALQRWFSDWWYCSSRAAKVHTFLISGTLIFVPLTVWLGGSKGVFVEAIQFIGGLFFLVGVGYFLAFLDFMFRTPHRRRIFYLMIIFGLFGAAILTMWFADEDTDVQPIMMAAMFSTILLVPAFISYLRFPYYYHDDDDN